jgi:hypothetical protein
MRERERARRRTTYTLVRRQRHPSPSPNPLDSAEAQRRLPAEPAAVAGPQLRVRVNSVKRSGRLAGSVYLDSDFRLIPIAYRIAQELVG